MTNRVEELRKCFTGLDTRYNGYKKFEVPNWRQASVLVPLFYLEGEWNVLLTVRSKHLRSHSGLVAFPGGHADDDDTDEVSTALREAEEEIGLPPTSVDVIAVLPQSVVRPNKIVSVVVGVISPNFTPRINKQEVHKTFSLPLSRFLKDDCTKQEFHFGNAMFYSYFFNDIVDGKLIVTYGFTAVYCMQIALVVLHSNKEFTLRVNNVITRTTAFDPVATMQYLDSLFKHKL